MDFSSQKNLVKQYQKAMELANNNDRNSALSELIYSEYHWRGMHPFYEQKGVEAVLDVFWNPLTSSFTRLQRREDIFFAGHHLNDSNEAVWVVSMGHFMGLFDKAWLGIRPTGRIAMIRYAEFHRVEKEKIVETALFLDILSVMEQAGQYPLPPMTGASFIYPGPRYHDGVLLEQQDPDESQKTLELVDKMVADLTNLNVTTNDDCPPEVLEKTWLKDMTWYGPTGIGASYTIRRYQLQHQYPFRKNLTDKVFNGHIARLAEGNYCGFFGWPNLNNRNKGGFLGLPNSHTHAPMRVVDIYRREGDKLAENWVFIDLLHYLYEQGLDVLDRNRQFSV